MIDTKIENLQKEVAKLEVKIENLEKQHNEFKVDMKAIKEDFDYELKDLRKLFIDEIKELKADTKIQYEDLKKTMGTYNDMVSQGKGAKKVVTLLIAVASGIAGAVAYFWNFLKP